MNFELIQKTAIFIFGLFLVFSAIVLLVGEYINNTLLAIVVFVGLLYGVYYLFLKTFIDD